MSACGARARGVAAFDAVAAPSGRVDAVPLAGDMSEEVQRGVERLSITSLPLSGTSGVSAEFDELLDSPPPSPPDRSPTLGLRRASSGVIEIPQRDRGEEEEEEPPHVLVGPSSLEQQPLLEVEEPQQRLTPDDFEILSLVGQGAFGKARSLRTPRPAAAHASLLSRQVFSVKKRSNGRVFAMKVMRKAHVVEKNQARARLASRRLPIPHSPPPAPGRVHAHRAGGADPSGAPVHRDAAPLVPGTRPLCVPAAAAPLTPPRAVQTGSKLYLVLDFVNGGHLFFQLYRAGIFEEALARVYTAEIVLALTHLHSLGIVHRDLKPENILLDAEGHIRVTDFGLAVVMAEGHRSNSLVGTIEYMAPEIIASRGHTKAADWWSVGVLLFEMLTGAPPFRAKNRALLQKKILSEKIKFPAFLTQHAHKLLTLLLQRDESKRLGGRAEGGSEDVQSHPFFKLVNWRMLGRREIAAR